ncbi:Z-ring formation inhibitor MciZ [Bacillaceae bacterium Marseille-Q3522]|nr:Z-ring formation inhibitor MciZ [Bacillaceae bacterium Marseille-Q3522]
MKVIVYNKGIVMSGKAWEVREKLKIYAKKYLLVADWIADVAKSK